MISKKSSSSIMKVISVGCILLILVFAHSMINYSHAAKKNSIQNKTSPSPIPLPTPPPGLLGTLKIAAQVSGGNNKPSDFSITVSGNSPKPKSFSGSSSGTTVTLKPGKYSVSESAISGYTTKYSSGCSNIASGGVLIKCTITNKYYGKTASQSPSASVSSILITVNSRSLYSIPSTFVKLDGFSTNYTVTGKISSINDSRDLITSAIVDDFDKNPNIGYVVNGTSALTTGSQLSIPNPFVGKDIINQKITAEIQNVIAAASVKNIAEKNLEIKCTFGMILSNFECS